MRLYTRLRWGCAGLGFSPESQAVQTDRASKRSPDFKEVTHGREEEGDQQGLEEGPCKEEGRQEEEVAPVTFLKFRSSR